MKKDYLLIAASASFFGYISVGGRLLVNLGYSLYEVSLLPVLTVMLILCLLIIYRPKYLPSKITLPFFIIYGLIGAFLQIAQFGGIVLGIPIAIVIMLLYTQPIWTTLLSKFWLGEKITKYKTLAIILSISGVFIILNPTSKAEFSSTLGLIFSLIAGIVLSLWIIWGRKSLIYKLHPISKIFGYVFFTSLWLIIMFPVFSALISNPRLTGLSICSIVHCWHHLLLVVFLGYLIPYFLFFMGIKGVNASSAGTLMMLEPVSATLLATILFGESITLNIIIGGGLVLVSNYIIIKCK